MTKSIDCDSSLCAKSDQVLFSVDLNHAKSEHNIFRPNNYKVHLEKSFGSL
jgi:hypothetical protein